MNDTPTMTDWDFCWFARDEAGHYAAITTGGLGPIPDSIRPFVDQHNEIECALDQGAMGSRDWWKSWAAAGLFVYDWPRPTGPGTGRGHGSGSALRTFVTTFFHNLRRPRKTEPTATESIRTYRRLGVATASIPDDIARRLRALPHVPVCPGDFRDKRHLDVAELRDGG